MKVELNYFKNTGKWYTEASYETNLKDLHSIWNEIRGMKETKELPGLISGHGDLLILVDVPEHPNRHPHLII